MSYRTVSYKHRKHVVGVTGLKKELTNSASSKSVNELLKFDPEMELALTLTRFLMHLYLKKLILEVPNTMFEGVMDKAAMFYN